MSLRISGHYGFVIAGACFLIVFCNMGLASTSFNVYQPYLVALPGIGDTAGAVVIGVRTLFAFLAMFVVVRYYQLLGYRYGAALCCASTALAFLIYANASSLVPLCIAAAFAGFSYGMGGMVCVTYLVNNWFKTDVGTVVGIAAIGSGIASMVVPLCAEWVIRTFSLSTSFYLEAALAALIAACVALALRNKPADMGLAPYSGSEQKVREEERPDAITHGVHLSPRANNAMVFACALLGASTVAALAFLSVLIVSEGQSHEFAAMMLALSGLVLTIGKAVLGRAFDKLGVLWGSVAGFGALALGFVLLCLGASGSAPIVVAGVAICSFGVALASTGISVWSIHFSLPEERVSTIKRFQTGYVFGSFAFSFAPGLLKDLVGSYVLSYALMGVMVLLSAAIVLATHFAYERHRVAAA